MACSCSCLFLYSILVTQLKFKTLFLDTKNDEKCKIMLVLTSVNGFAFRLEILYLCIAEVEMPLEIVGISTFFVPKNPFLGAKNKLPSFFKVKQPVFNVTYSAPHNRY